VYHEYSYSFGASGETHVKRTNFVKAGKYLVSNFVEMPKLTLEEAIKDVLKRFYRTVMIALLGQGRNRRTTTSGHQHKQAMHKFQFMNCKVSHEGAQVSYRNAVLISRSKTKADSTSDQTTVLREGVDSRLTRRKDESKEDQTVECMPTTLPKQKPQQKIPPNQRQSPCCQSGLDASRNADCDDDVAERRLSVSMPEAYWCVRQ
jgi:hypothetical protein